jgi:zinc transporter ZupT
MTHTTPQSRVRRLLTHAAASAITLCAAIGAHSASASVFNGGGLQEGLASATMVKGLASGNVRTSVTRIITTVLNFLGLIATAMVIIAGIYYITSLGEDDRKEKAKKIIQGTLLGLMIVLFARTIVGLVTVYLAGQL